jgi:competence protein ComEA
MRRRSPCLLVLSISALLVSAPLALSAAKKKPPLYPINLNTATALQQVPGIGPSTAAKILNMRKSHGPVKSVDDLRAIKGIGPQAHGKNAQVFDDWKATRAKASAERARK